MSEKIREMLRKAVRESSPHGPDVKFDDSTAILAEGIIDSLGIFAVMTEIEEELGFAFPPDEITADNFRSVDVLSELVQRLLASAALSKEAAQ